MKKLDKLILKSYIGPLILTFSISMFVLVLQFLWRKVETLIGKGLDIYVILKMFAYASASLVPLALPISILLASIMTMGNFSERSEITAMKSAGLPLWRIFRPLIILSIILSAIAFYFSSFLIPGADMQLKMVAGDIRDKKPTINIRPQEFYTDISSYVIRIDKKDNTTNKMYGILVYNHSKDIGNIEVIKADSGYMYSDENNQTLFFELYSGNVFQEDISDENIKNRPLTRIGFKKQIIRFDVSDFAFQEGDKDRYSDFYKVMNISDLYKRIDSLTTIKTQQNDNYRQKIFETLSLKTNKVKNDNNIKYDFFKDFSALDSLKKNRIESECNNYLSYLQEDFQTKTYIESIDKNYLDKHWIEFYRKFTLSIACIILFFVGAPLGSIIRKGGLGMPVVVSIIAFAIYYVIGMIGESSAKGGSISPLLAMWLSSIVFFPIGIFLTLKASFDSKIFSIETWNKIFHKIINIFNKNKKN